MERSRGSGVGGIREGANGPGTGSLLERDLELAEIDGLLDDAGEGRGRLALIEGPPGIGKTRLLGEAGERAAALGFTVLASRGGEVEREFAFGVVRQLLEPATAGFAPQQREGLMAGAAGLAKPIFADSAGLDERIDDPSFAVLHGLYWLTANLAEHAPLLLAVDDAHWADPASFRFIAFLARRLEGLRVLCVVTARPAEPGADPSALAELGHELDARLIRPRALSERAAGELVRAELLETATEELCAACHEATRGNPFFLGELLNELHRELDAAGTLSPAAVRQLGPRRISTAVLLRVGRLPDPAPALARAVAVLGEHAELRSAAVLAGLDPLEGGRIADALADAGVLEAARPLRFVHPIVRMAIHDDIPPSERAAAHARAARVLADAGASADSVAGQLLLSDPVGDPWVVDRLRVAAVRALARGAPDEAVRSLRRAMREPPPDAEAARVLFELGSACVLAGESDAADTLAGALELATDPKLRAEIALELGAQTLYEGRVGDTLEVVEGELDRLRGAEPKLAVQLESELLITGMTTISARRLIPERFARARARIESLPAGAARLLLPCVAMDVATRGGDANQVAELAGRALAPGPFGIERAGWVLSAIAVHALVITDRLDGAQRASSDAIAAARARGSAYGFSLASALRALARLRQGDLERAESDAATSLELAAEIGWGVFHPLALAVIVSALVERGEPGGARAALAAAPTDAEGTAQIGRDASYLDQYTHEAVARLVLAEGNPEAALAELRACERFEAEFAARPSIVPIAWRSLAALAHLALDDPEGARVLAEQDVELARRFGAPRALGVALRVLGIVQSGRGGRNIELLRESVSMLERSPARLEHARALCDLGAALRRANRRADAREPLRAGHELALGCGAGAVAEAARKELAAAGGRPRPPLATGREALTPSERRVADLAAEGSSNREIAQALFVTLKTVEMHLSNAYRKLDISSRTELAAALNAPGEPEIQGR
jgi:DNA-binding CsgD family transcriptional regulator